MSIYNVNVERSGAAVETFRILDENNNVITDENGNAITFQ